jgi:hypothetical protein
MGVPRPIPASRSNAVWIAVTKPVWNRFFDRTRPERGALDRSGVIFVDGCAHHYCPRVVALMVGAVGIVGIVVVAVAAVVVVWALTGVIGVWVSAVAISSA